MEHTIGIVGGGIIGLAIAYKLQIKYPNSKVIVFEKEQNLGKHQSGNNSGVLHCGLYYKPGSLKAKLAVEGIQQMTEFCIENNIEHDICGKIVVATNETEVIELDKLYHRGQENGLKGLRYLTPEELREREPFVWAEKALLVPQEGIVDFKAVMNQLATYIINKGGEIHKGVKIDYAKETDEHVIISNGIEEWKLNKVICCTGLHSDKTFELFTKQKSPIRIIPFRGEYLELVGEGKNMVNHLIYPTPDPQYPFLGVHFTRMVGGSKEVGPNAVFATKREGYSNKDFSLKDTIQSISYTGFIKFVTKNFAFSMNEFYTSLSKKAFLKKAQKMIPELEESHIRKGGASGVRAQAISEQGELLMDFSVMKVGKQVHVLNAPSPGATASLSIADYIISTYVDN